MEKWKLKSELRLFCQLLGEVLATLLMDFAEKLTKPKIKTCIFDNSLLVPIEELRGFRKKPLRNLVHSVRALFLRRESHVFCNPHFLPARSYEEPLKKLNGRQPGPQKKVKIRLSAVKELINRYLRPRRLFIGSFVDFKFFHNRVPHVRRIPRGLDWFLACNDRKPCGVHTKCAKHLWMTQFLRFGGAERSENSYEVHGNKTRLS